jgi:hypothetical protein
VKFRFGSPAVEVSGRKCALQGRAARRRRHLPERSAGRGQDAGKVHHDAGRRRKDRQRPELGPNGDACDALAGGGRVLRPVVCAAPPTTPVVEKWRRCGGHSVRRHGYCGYFRFRWAEVDTLCTLESHITSRASSELEPNGVPRDGFDRIGAPSHRWVAEGGEGHTLALSVEGGVFVWGSNLMKQLGLPGVSIRSAVPELLVMDDGAKDRP